MTTLPVSVADLEQVIDEIERLRKGETAAVNQNDAMRQDLVHVGNLVSDLARAMGVDQANDDGSWPDLAARVGKLIDHARKRLRKDDGEREAIPMLLFCPMCGIQHIDEPDERTPEWDNPPHRSHLCHACGTIWRPADVATVGVVRIETVGKADTWGESNSAALSLTIPNDTPVRGLEATAQELTDEATEQARIGNYYNAYAALKKVVAALTSKQTVSVDRAALAVAIDPDVAGMDLSLPCATGSRVGRALAAADRVRSVLASAPPLDGENDRG